MFKNKLFIILLAAAFIFSFPLSSPATETDAWTVKNFGVMKVPAKWQTVRLEDVLEKIAAATENQPNANDAIRKGISLIRDANLNIFHITSEDNNCYYTATLFLYKDSKPMSEESNINFSKNKKLQRETISQLSKLQSYLVSSIHELPLTDYSLNIVARPAGPVETISFQDGVAYAVGTRIVTNIYGLNYPYYLKAYLLNLDGHLTFAVLCANDSERVFWDKTFKPVITSLR